MPQGPLVAIVRDVKPGDILGFSGQGWISAIINLGSYGLPWRGLSHVGIVAWASRDGLLLFESTSLSSLPCVISRRRVSGVQAHRVPDIVADYNGRVYHYPLYRDLYEHEMKRLERYLRGNIGRPYDTIGAIRSGGLCLAWVEALCRSQNLYSFFCSELVASSLAKIGVFATTNASRWNPNRLVRTLRCAGILCKPRRLK